MFNTPQSTPLTSDAALRFAAPVAPQGSPQSALPITRLRITARAESPLQLPPYAGSMLRGALGHALLALAPLPHPDDGPCALQASCPYCALFVAPPPPAHHLRKLSQMPHPYVVEPPAGDTHVHAGGTFDFSIVLIGKALAYEGAVAQAFERALRTGLTNDRVHCTLVAIECETVPPSAVASSPAQSATLQFTTPLWLAKQGRPIRAAQALDASTLLVALARRYQLLADACWGDQAPQQNFAELIAQASAVHLQSEGVRWFNWGRYSQHQQREMHFGGLTGTVRLQGDLAPFAALLHQGQWLHVGKKATFGMGGYRLQLAG